MLVEGFIRDPPFLTSSFELLGYLSLGPLPSMLVGEEKRHSQFREFPALMSTPSPNRIRQILEVLESSRQDLLDLAGEIWETIDPTDEDDLEAGYEFMKTFNKKVQKLDETSEAIGDLVEDYLDVEFGEQSEAAGPFTPHVREFRAGIGAIILRG